MVQIRKLPPGVTVAEARQSLLALTYHDVLGRLRPMYTEPEVAAMSDDEVGVSYFTEFYVDEHGGA
jgi:hypothetical protein